LPRSGVEPCRLGGADHVLDDADAGHRVARALGIAAAEGADDRHVHAADEADRTGLARHRRQDAGQERALLLLEAEGADVGRLDRAVDDGEADVGEGLGRRGHGGDLGEAHADDQRRPVVDQLAQDRLAVRFEGQLVLAEGGAGGAAIALGALQARLVEALVVLAADVEDDGRDEPGRCRILGPCGTGQEQRQEGRQETEHERLAGWRGGRGFRYTAYPAPVTHPTRSSIRANDSGAVSPCRGGSTSMNEPIP
jgi:hypothetical protein